MSSAESLSAALAAARKAGATGDDACQAIIHHHSKSFSLASRLLPARCRADAVIAYAWCRRADDAVDQSAAGAEAIEILRRELDDVYAMRSIDDPILSAFARVVHDRRIPRHYPDELINGMAMDVRGGRYERWEDLLLYAYRVAGVVGLLMCHVMGVSSDDALPMAASLGVAMQLTNIARDVAEDWRRGRCYLPAEFFSPAVRPAINPRADESIPSGVLAETPAVVKRILSLADRYYAAGDQGLCYLSPRCGLAIRTARQVYSAIGRRIARNNYNVTAGRAIVSNREKVALAASAALATMADAASRAVTRRSRVYAAPMAALEFRDVLRVA